MVVAQRFDEIAGGELHVVELGEVKNMRFGKHGRRDIQRVANFRLILEKMRVSQFFGVIVYELFTDMTVRYQFSPNSHIRIIHEKAEKVNCFNGLYFPFFPHRINCFKKLSLIRAFSRGTAFLTKTDKQTLFWRNLVKRKPI